MKFMKFDVNIDLSESKEPEEPCKGLFWRGRVTSWFNGVSVTSRKSLNLLKRKSCKGCEYCDWVYEYLHEDLSNFQKDDIIGKIEDGKLYQIQFNSSRDFESGWDEIDDWEFVEVKE